MFIFKLYIHGFYRKSSSKIHRNVHFSCFGFNYAVLYFVFKSPRLCYFLNIIVPDILLVYHFGSFACNYALNVVDFVTIKSVSYVVLRNSCHSSVFFYSREYCLGNRLLRRRNSPTNWL